MKPPSRANLLLIAYACRPGENSEREVGWRWANLIQRHHNVTVLTRAAHRPYIDAALAASTSDEPAPQFLYYDLPEWTSLFKRGERGLYLYYTLWTWLAVNMARRLNQGKRWNLTHFLTFGTLLMPPVAFQMNTPYVLGPVGGGEHLPNNLLHSFGFKEKIKIRLRRIAQRSLFLNPIYRLNLARADKLFIRTKETMELLPKQYHEKCELLLETAISPTEFQPSVVKTNTGRLEIISVGRLIPSKFNPLMLEALARFKSMWTAPFRMTVIGDGPERARLEKLRDHLGLTEVVFTGKKSRDDVFSALRNSDIYFSTTMKEGGTWAFFEAIASRLPVVCLKVNGPDMIVGDGCGVKVETKSAGQSLQGLSAGLLELADDPELRQSYADAAVRYLEKNFTWERILERVDQAYADVLTQTATP